MCEEIAQLLDDGEEYDKILKLEHETLMLRWVNHYLCLAGQEPVNNLGKDLADSTALLYLLNQLDSNKCKLDGLEEPDELKRAELVIANAQALGVDDVVAAVDITMGNPKVSIIFISELFKVKQTIEEQSQFSHLETDVRETLAQQLDELTHPLPEIPITPKGDVPVRE